MLAFSWYAQHREYSVTAKRKASTKSKVAGSDCEIYHVSVLLLPT